MNLKTTMTRIKSTIQNILLKVENINASCTMELPRIKIKNIQGLHKRVIMGWKQTGHVEKLLISNGYF